MSKLALCETLMKMEIFRPNIRIPMFMLSMQSLVPGTNALFDSQQN